MKMTIEEMKEKCPWLEYVLIEAATKKDKDVTKIWEEIPKHWDIKFIANGVELPIVETFLEIEKQHDRMIKEEAKDLINEKLNEFDDFFKTLKRQIKSKMFDDLNIDYNKDDIY